METATLAKENCLRRVGLWPILRKRDQSIAIAESSTGGMIRGLLALPGASAYSSAARSPYTPQAKILQLGLDKAALTQFRPGTEPHTLLLPPGAQAGFAAAWGLGETGADWHDRDMTVDQMGSQLLVTTGPSSCASDFQL